MTAADLRHTFATLALQNGVDIKTVPSMLGHYDAGFTLRTYTHATRQMQDQAAETMGSFMAQVMYWQPSSKKTSGKKAKLPARSHLSEFCCCHEWDHNEAESGPDPAKNLRHSKQ